MKLDNDKRDNIESVKKQKEQRQTSVIGRIKPNKGHILFEVDLKERTISVAEFKKCNISWIDAVNRDYSKYKKVVSNKNCIYISALNTKNVKKKLTDKRINHTFKIL
tara:strand:- start:1686 stop:2006 length:321 start_codon:yes stop_codon:yes gene_type:complete